MSKQTIVMVLLILVVLAYQAGRLSGGLECIRRIERSSR